VYIDDTYQCINIEKTSLGEQNKYNRYYFSMLTSFNLEKMSILIRTKFQQLELGALIYEIYNHDYFFVETQYLRLNIIYSFGIVKSIK